MQQAFLGHDPLTLWTFVFSGFAIRFVVPFGLRGFLLFCLLPFSVFFPFMESEQF
jgi:hypothetical protein